MIFTGDPGTARLPSGGGDPSAVRVALASGVCGGMGDHTPAWVHLFLRSLWMNGKQGLV